MTCHGGGRRRLPGLLPAAVAALLLLAGAAEAQQAPARPRWSFTGAFGIGAHPSRSGEVHYGSSRSETAHLALAHRLGGGPVRPLLRAELLTEGPGSDPLDCPRAPTGTCERDFPAPDGVGIAAGLAVQATGRIETSLVAGVGRYDETTRTFLEAEGAVVVTRRLALTVALRHMAWREPELGRLWYRPASAGLRLSW
jgi:hypothetical protein